MYPCELLVGIFALLTALQILYAPVDKVLLSEPNYIFSSVSFDLVEII